MLLEEEDPWKKDESESKGGQQNVETGKGDRKMGQMMVKEKAVVGRKVGGCRMQEDVGTQETATGRGVVSIERKVGDCYEMH